MMTNSFWEEEEEKLRQVFKWFNKFMLLMWRLGLGSILNAWPEVAGRIMVVTHVGRKTGNTYRTPVNYALVDGEIYCTAGFGDVSDWYKNIMANPSVEVWLPNGWWQGVAEDVTDSEDHIALMRAVLIGSGFAARLVGIDPRRISDDQLARITAMYRLIHIRRTRPQTGAGGPSDLAWVWIVLTILLLIFRKRKRKP